MLSFISVPVTVAFDSRTGKMRLYLDDSDLILKQLKRLYLQLPLDLRSDKPMIAASELIFEAVEFIDMLKFEGLKPVTGETNNNGDTKKVSEPIVILPFRNENSQPVPKNIGVAHPVTIDSRVQSQRPQLANPAPQPPSQQPPERPPLSVSCHVRIFLGGGGVREFSGGKVASLG